VSPVTSCFSSIAAYSGLTNLLAQEATSPDNQLLSRHAAILR